MDLFQITRSFPKEERYSLIDQLVRSSRSISANIAEGWGKRIYEGEFKKHLIYAIGSLEETKTWLRFSLNCNFITDHQYMELENTLDELGAKIYKLYGNCKSF